MCDKRMIIINKIIKKSNHVYIGKEARNVERKQPLYLTNITLDWLREKNSIVIYFLTTSTLMTYMYVVLLKQILQIDT